MRKILVGLAAMAFAAAAHAEPRWTTPGWYQIADTDHAGPIVWKGPFADKATCLQTLPPNDAEADYDCEYHGERPGWDE